MFDFEKTKSGLVTLKYNNKYIHSKYNPEEESNRFAECNIELINKPIIVLYGIGLGYNVDSIVKRMSVTSKLYVFENNEILIECCKKVNEKIFHYNNVYIIYGNNKKFYNKLSQCLGMVKNFIIHRPSLETIKNSNGFLYNLLNDFSNMKQFDEINYDMAIRSEENFNNNIKRNYPNISELIERVKNSDKPYIVTASGPSLDMNLELLKKHENNFNIIAVGSSLRSLFKYNIVPKIVVIVDTKEIVKKQFVGIDCSCINLCFESHASRWAVEYYNGPKYIFNDNTLNDVKIANGGTVAVAALDIAIKCGAKEIVMLGQDLAFINKKSHTSTFEETYGIKDVDRDIDILKQIKGVDGNVVYTNQGYITFKNKIEALIRKNKNVKFINSSKGAFIEGTSNIVFEEYINRFIK